MKAEEEGRVVVTLDADFHSLLALKGAKLPSVIRIRIERLKAQALTSLLLSVLPECEENLLKGAVVTIESTCVRLRLLPLVK